MQCMLNVHRDSLDVAEGIESPECRLMSSRILYRRRSPLVRLSDQLGSLNISGRNNSERQDRLSRVSRRYRLPYRRRII